MSKRPEWLDEWRKRTRIIDIIEKAYASNCDCEVCQDVRELGEEMGELFRQMPPQLPQFPGGAPKSRKTRKKR